MVISKRRGIIIHIVCHVLLVPGYQHAWSVIPGLLPYGVFFVFSKKKQEVEEV